MQVENIKKPSCIVDFDNEAEIDRALQEAINDTSEPISFEEMLEKTMDYLNNLTINRLGSFIR